MPNVNAIVKLRHVKAGRALSDIAASFQGLPSLAKSTFTHDHLRTHLRTFIRAYAPTF